MVGGRRLDIVVPVRLVERLHEAHRNLATCPELEVRTLQKRADVLGVTIIPAAVEGQNPDRVAEKRGIHDQTHWQEFADATGSHPWYRLVGRP